MVLEEINVDGFGIYNDFKIDGLKKGLNIVLGNNEAGKTTLQKFIRFTLFGYPRLKDQRMPPVNGGTHGGSIKALLDSGDRLTIIRTGADRVSAYLPDKDIVDEDDLRKVLGNASPSLYENVYSLTLDELVSLSSLNQSGVEDKIFSIGMGLGNISLAGIESDIRSEIDQIYKPGGRVQKIPQLIKEIDQVKTSISAKREMLPEYLRLSEELEMLGKKRESLENDYKSKTLYYARLKNYLKCYDQFLRISDIDRQLKKLPELANYSDVGLVKLDRAEERESGLKERIQELISGSEVFRGIEELEKELGMTTYNKSILEDPEKVEYILNNISNYLNALRDYRQDEVEITKLREEVRDSIDNINPEWDLADIVGIKGIKAHKGALSSFRDRKDECRRTMISAEASADAIKSHNDGVNVNSILTIISLLFIIFSIPAFYYTLYVLGGALVIAGLSVIGTRVLVNRQSEGPDIFDQIEKLKQTERNLQEEYIAYIENNLNLPASLPMEDAGAVLSDIERIMGMIKMINDISTRQKEQKEPLIKQFEKIVGSVASKLESSFRDETYEILASRIKSEYNSARKSRDLHSSLEKELNEKVREKKIMERRVDEIAAEKNDLIKSIKAVDSNDFRQKYKINSMVKSLTVEKEKAVQTIESIVGYGESESVLKFFGSRTKDSVEDEIKLGEDIIKNLEEELDYNKTRTGELRNEVSRLEKQSDIAPAMTELETVRSKLEMARNNWLTGRLSIWLLNRVRELYEKEKQPAVINNAGRYFSSVTEGKYDKVFVSLDSREVKISSDLGVHKTISELSRGTREQLLLSLRLGFIEEYEKHAEPLPVIADEIMVNFDQARAMNMAKNITEFSFKRQVIILTCHPETIDLFDKKRVNIITL